MLTLKELGLLARDTILLWARFFPTVAGWFALGYGIRLAAMQVAVIVGTERVILGNLYGAGIAPRILPSRRIGRSSPCA